jgi:hypothetical protein
MKGLITVCFLPIVVTFALHTGNLPVFTQPDTVKVISVGVNNRVVIDSICLGAFLNDTISSPVKGEITQTGENNQVEISTGNTTPKQIKQEVTIKQTGKNNSVKINSR